MAGITISDSDTFAGRRHTLSDGTPHWSGSGPTRRQFLRSAAGLGFSAAALALLNGCGGPPTAPATATEALETNTIKVPQFPSICVAAQYVAEDLLRREGFSDVQYIKETGSNDSYVDLAAGTDNYDYAFYALSHLPYNKWREYDPEDTLRFYALRLRESGMLKSSPDELITKGADWRFLNELKRELPTSTASVENSGLLCRLGERG